MDKRSIMLEHNENPINKGLVNDSDYIKVSTKNESCIDHIDIMFKINNNVIEDIVFDGEACVITISSTSLMIKNLIGKTIEEALTIISNFENMIENKSYDINILGELNVYDEIYKQPSRKMCALLPYIGIKDYLTKECK